MPRFVTINKRTFLQDFLGIILIFVSMLLQVYYFFGYTDQGSLYQLIKGKEFLIYVFNAVVCLHILWKLCSKNNKALYAVYAFVTAAIYTLYFVVYHVYLRLAVETSPDTKEEVLNLLVQYVKADLLNHPVKYIIVLALMLVICLFVAVATPKAIKHKIHVLKVEHYKKSNLTSDMLVNIERELYIVKALGNKLIVSVDEDHGTQINYDIELDVRNWNDQSVYLVFTNNELDDNNRFTYYVGKRDRKKGLLVPIRNQDVFDKIEEIIIK